MVRVEKRSPVVYFNSSLVHARYVHPNSIGIDIAIDFVPGTGHKRPELSPFLGPRRTTFIGRYDYVRLVENNAIQ